jgi:hypothetical protein
VLGFSLGALSAQLGALRARHLILGSISPFFLEDDDEPERWMISYRNGNAATPADVLVGALEDEQMHRRTTAVRDGYRQRSEPPSLPAPRLNARAEDFSLQSATYRLSSRPCGLAAKMKNTITLLVHLRRQKFATPLSRSRHGPRARGARPRLPRPAAAAAAAAARLGGGLLARAAHYAAPSRGCC